MPTYRADDGTGLAYDLRGKGEPLIVLAGGAALHPDYLGGLSGSSDVRQLVVPHLRGVGPPAWLVDEPSDAGPLIDARRGEPAFDAALVGRQQTLPDELDDAAFNAWQQSVAPFAYARGDDELAAHARAGWWSFAAAKADFSIVPPEDVAHRLRAVQAPVLLVAGAQDCTTGLQPVVAVAELFPAAAPRCSRGARTSRGSSNRPRSARRSTYIVSAPLARLAAPPLGPAVGATRRARGRRQPWRPGRWLT